jgi:hypothetical protein
MQNTQVQSNNSSSNSTLQPWSSFLRWKECPVESRAFDACMIAFPLRRLPGAPTALPTHSIDPYTHILCILLMIDGSGMIDVRCRQLAIEIPRCIARRSCEKEEKQMKKVCERDSVRVGEEGVQDEWRAVQFSYGVSCHSKETPDCHDGFVQLYGCLKKNGFVFNPRDGPQTDAQPDLDPPQQYKPRKNI